MTPTPPKAVEERLKPCPFCQSKDVLVIAEEKGLVVFRAVHCAECGAIGPEHGLLLDAKVAWNTRPPASTANASEGKQDAQSQEQKEMRAFEEFYIETAEYSQRDLFRAGYLAACAQKQEELQPLLHDRAAFLERNLAAYNEIQRLRIQLQKEEKV